MSLLFHHLRHLLNVTCTMANKIKWVQIYTQWMSSQIKWNICFISNSAQNPGEVIGFSRHKDNESYKTNSSTVYFSLEERGQHWAIVCQWRHINQKGQTACRGVGLTLEVFKLPLLRSVLIDCWREEMAALQLLANGSIFCKREREKGLREFIRTGSVNALEITGAPHHSEKICRPFWRKVF